MISLLEFEALGSTSSSITLPKIVSLFSGAGGLDLGFQKAGYEVVLAVDCDHWAVETHKAAFPGSMSLQADLVELGVDGFLKILKPLLVSGEKIGVIGGPPCQGFSRSNVSSKPDDPRNKLPMLYLQIVKALQDKYAVEFIVFENVLGIQDKKHQTTFDSIQNTLQSFGLHQSVKVYDAYEFGVPQHRRRVVIAAFASDEVLRSFLPEKQVEGKRTVGEVTDSLPEPLYFSRNAELNPFHPNHWTMQPRSSRFSHPDEQSWDARSFRRLKSDEPSPTVAYGHREIHIHPNGKRRLSIYEAMLIQGFPSEYRLYGSFSAQVQQVSNAVPPPLAFSLAVAIRESLAQM